MGDFDNIGKLMHLPLANIEPEVQISKPEFIITAAAEAIYQSAGRNWIPVIVKETSDYHYQVVSNHFVYAVAQQAALERVWCIVIEPDAQNIEQAKILAGEAIPKVNLNTASRDTILAALRYLIAEPASALKGVDVIVATNRIAAADRKSWSSFNSIIALKCGITKGKKLDALSKVFFLSPSTPPPPLPPEVVSIKHASRDEIFTRLSYLSTYKIDGFEKFDAESIANILFTASKGKWKSLNPISKLGCDIDTAKIKTLKTVFSL
ncbi:hypothetical protein H6G81_25045 [Scytonema hofmannii FACHB-248]|uniref:Uncharacterized protein n=1 Tax=Scytonema hofmannii FACHB-248 TaxID=1842502 RepID=A0ABR8GX59_9CYAN|nr:MULTISPECIES: hypothetical protein [Nostocales]MBD2607705.1 hypothetical protein [Scytonema hofmannii FACHB-248]